MIPVIHCKMQKLFKVNLYNTQSYKHNNNNNPNTQEICNTNNNTNKLDKISIV